MFNAARLKQLRKEYGFTQIQMAQKLHIEQSTYCKLEKNNYDLNMNVLQILNDDFKVDAKEFLNSYKLKNELVQNSITIQKSEITGGGGEINNLLQQNIDNQKIMIQNQQAILLLLQKLIKI